MALETSPQARACRHLRKYDPRLDTLIAAVGPSTLEPGGDPFTILVRSIVAQLISTAAAEVRRIAEPMSPYRSVATWYMWRNRGLVPQSG